MYEMDTFNFVYWRRNQIKILSAIVFSHLKTFWCRHFESFIIIRSKHYHTIRQLIIMIIIIIIIITILTNWISKRLTIKLDMFVLGLFYPIRKSFGKSNISDIVFTIISIYLQFFPIFVCEFSIHSFLCFLTHFMFMFMLMLIEPLAFCDSNVECIRSVLTLSVWFLWCSVF